MEKLYKKLTEYCCGDTYPLHMPGHKRSKAISMCNPFSIDITEIDGFDNLHMPAGVIADAQDDASRLYQTKKTFFLVNGSSGGLLTAICACSEKGSRVLLARNCHVAVYNAVILNELLPVYVMPETDSSTTLAMHVSPQSVKRALNENQDIKLVIITSPTYDGFVSDIASIAEIVHDHNALLIVDEAHGAHFGFHPAFPESAAALGADVVVQSLHKTLPSLTQTALLHICSDRVSCSRIKLYFDIFHTTSPSYVMMSSIQRCIDFLGRSCNEFSQYAARLDNFYRLNSSLKHLGILDVSRKVAAFKRDFGKILIFSDKTGMTGQNLYDILLEDYKLQAEMASLRYCLCMTSVCDTDEGINRLTDALHKIDAKLSSTGITVSDAPSPIMPELPIQEMPPCDAYSCSRRLYPAKEASGLPAADFVYLYPPGCPLLVPGELFSPDMLSFIGKCLDEGLTVSNVQIESSELYVNVLL